MFCYNCGTEIEPNALFCRSCGTRVQKPSAFDNSVKKVILANSGKNKLSVIKEIRILLGYGLAEAKNLCDRTPQVLKEKVTNAEAEEIKRTFEAVGATIIIE